MTARHSLTINTGSSSLKAAVYEAGQEGTRILSGVCERIGLPNGRFRITDPQGRIVVDQECPFPDHRAALQRMQSWLQTNRSDLTIDAIGHRVVHGGPQYREPQRVTPQLIANLTELISLAPEHLPQAILVMQAMVQSYPDIPQVACFDTAFHRRMPRVAQMYPLPEFCREDGLFRYGFHGISYEYIMQQLGKLAPNGGQGRVILAHLGNGASLAAVRDGVSIDTTMGFTPGGGLMMGTRAGDLDPGVLIHLMTKRQMTPEALNVLVNKKSGLMGVSGTSADMRDLLAREATDPNAADAVALFCYQAKKYLGAMAAVLGGLDTLVFTGGIGEHAAPVRLRICDGLGYLGVQVDAARNDASAPVISADNSSVAVRVIKTDEESIIAQSVYRIMNPDILST